MDNKSVLSGKKWLWLAEERSSKQIKPISKVEKADATAVHKLSRQQGRLMGQ